MPHSTQETWPISQMDSSILFIEEMSHRVINDYARAISNLRLAATNIDDLPARHALLGAVRLLQARADAHRALRPPLGDGDFDIGDYLEEVCRAVSNASLADSGIQLTLSRCSAVLSSDLCWRLGLVVTELVNNAARHGLKWSAGEIRVELQITESELCCAVTNDLRSASLPVMGRGSRIVSALAADLGGRVDWLFHDRSVQAIILVPLPRNANSQHPC